MKLVKIVLYVKFDKGKKLEIKIDTIKHCKEDNILENIQDIMDNSENIIQERIK